MVILNNSCALSKNWVIIRWWLIIWFITIIITIFKSSNKLIIKCYSHYCYWKLNLLAKDIVLLIKLLKVSFMISYNVNIYYN